MVTYDPDELRCYVVVREDLEIPTGKFGGQVAHAVKFAWRSCHDRSEEGARRAWDYMRSPYQGVIVCRAKTLDDLLKVEAKAREAGLPCGLVEDHGRTVFPEPTVTCLGLGPLTEAERALPVVKRLQLWKKVAPGVDPMLDLLARVAPALRGCGNEALAAEVVAALHGFGRAG